MNTVRRTLSTGRLAMVALTATCVVVPTASAQELTFRFDGRGWGHGVGMSQFGAFGAAKKGLNAQQILNFYYTGVSFGTRPNETVRVLLNRGTDSPALTVTAADAPGTLYVLPSNDPVAMAQGQTYTARYVAPNVVVEGPGGTIVAQSLSGVRFAPGGKGLTAGSKSTLYAGTLSVTPDGAGLTVINSVDRETYLRGVVPRESHPKWGSEGGQAALEAQAVAARSYVASHLDPAGTWDVRATQADQVYGGISGVDTRTDAAVATTQNQVMTYNGAPIDAKFSSTSGGYTEDYVTVFGGSPVPYLVGKPDPYDLAEISEPRWAKPPTFTASVLGAKLGVGAPVATLDVTERGVSPRAKTVVVTTTTGVTKQFTGWQVRGLLDLKDSWFWVTRSDQATPTPEPPVGTVSAPPQTPQQPPVSEVARRGRWMVVAVRTARRADAQKTATRLRKTRPHRVMFRVGTRYFVATGRYAAYAEAVKERAAIRRLGLKAQVVAAKKGYPKVTSRRWMSPPAPLNTTGVPAPTQQGRFRVVVADVASSDAARPLLKKLADHRPAPRLLSVWTPLTGTRFMVVTLTAGNAARARAEQRALAARGVTGARTEPAS